MQTYPYIIQDGFKKALRGGGGRAHRIASRGFEGLEGRGVSS